MESDDEEIRLVCGAVGDPIVRVTPDSTRGEYCTICATELWMTARMRQTWQRLPQAQPICAECSVGVISDDDHIHAVGDDFDDGLAKRIHEGIRNWYGRTN